MTSSANHDSNPAIGATPVRRPGEYPDELPFELPDVHDSLPVFDLNSAEPLPDMPDVNLQPPPHGGWPAGTAASEGSTAGFPPSTGEPPASFGQAGAVEVSKKRKKGEIWLQGDVLMCGCPDCHAPMTIRLWLCLADCWLCGTSIELSEQQQREAKRLLERRAEQKEQAREAARTTPRGTGQREAVGASAGRTGSDSGSGELAGAAPDRTTPASDRPATGPADRRRDSDSREPRPDRDPRQPAGDRRQVGAAPGNRPQNRRRSASRRRPQHARVRTVSAWLSELFKQTPAWLVSLVFHLVLLTILGIWTFDDDDEDRDITLSTAVSQADREGGEQVQLKPQDEVDFDLPIPDKVDLTNENQRQAMIKADQEARELRLNPSDPDPNLPNLTQVKSQVRNGTRNAMAARDPRVRVEMVEKEGGTTLTEAAVARGLRWMSQHQSKDGSWSLNRFHRASGCRCNGQGGIHSDSAGTSLALLPFLGAGQTHLVGRYKETVSAGLRWLVENQKENGDLRARSSGNAGMYAHGQGAIVLCEAFLVSGDEELRAPAQKAIDFIAAAQHPSGGWRYSPGQAGDTSVLGWQLMALQSARAANLTVKDETFELAGHYLDSAQSYDGARYAYLPNRGRSGGTAAMTAEALLCRMYMGWTNDNPAMLEGMQWLADNHMPSRRAPNIYYWYYATQAFHHVGGTKWDRWNLVMRDILVNSQRRSGHLAGSWDPAGPHGSAGGRLYMTALSVCTLEVYYRHLPIFRQIELE